MKRNTAGILHQEEEKLSVCDRAQPLRRGAASVEPLSALPTGPAVPRFYNGPRGHTIDVLVGSPDSTADDLLAMLSAIVNPPSSR
ncbi:MAG TPA: hypothetical protein VM120_02540 [Bryobacteraceae bacterium]|nr:hypothetical protein [Bryobacteraceae bacterium]